MLHCFFHCHRRNISKANLPLKSRLCGKTTTLPPFLAGTYKRLETSTKKAETQLSVTMKDRCQKHVLFPLPHLSFPCCMRKQAVIRKHFFRKDSQAFGWFEVKHKHMSPGNPCSMHFTVIKEEEIISMDSFSPPARREMLAHGSPHDTRLSSAPCLCLHITPQPCWWWRQPMSSFRRALQTPPDFLSWDSQHVAAELLEPSARRTFPQAVQRQVSSRLYATLWALASFLCAVGLCRSSKFVSTPTALHSLCTIPANSSSRDA